MTSRVFFQMLALCTTFLTVSLWPDMSFRPKLPQFSFEAPDFKCHSFDKVECFFQENLKKKTHQKNFGATPDI